MFNYLVTIKKNRIIKEDIPITAVDEATAENIALNEWSTYALDDNDEITYSGEVSTNPDGMIRLTPSPLSSTIDISTNTIDCFDYMSFDGLDEADKLSLEYLYLSDCPVNSPPELNGFTNLLELYVTGSELIDPPILTDLVNLTTLDLAHNQLTSVPDLTTTRELVNLSLSYNPLTIAPNLNGLTMLNTVYMQECNLTEDAVNGILVDLASTIGPSNGVVGLENGTNAALTGAGLTAKTTLEARGWTVTVN